MGNGQVNLTQIHTGNTAFLPLFFGPRITQFVASPQPILLAFPANLYHDRRIPNPRNNQRLVAFSVGQPKLSALNFDS
jgi:hypothetical protein